MIGIGAAGAVAIFLSWWDFAGGISGCGIGGFCVAGCAQVHRDKKIPYTSPVHNLTTIECRLRWGEGASREAEITI